MKRSPAKLAGRIAIAKIERREPGLDRHLVDEGDGVGQRELQPPAASAAEQAAPAPSAKTAAPAEATGPAAFRGRSAAFGRRTRGRSALGALRPTLPKAELLTNLIERRLRGPARLQRLREIEPDPQRLAIGVIEIH